MTVIKLLLLLVLLVLTVLFAYFNLTKVKLSFFNLSYELPLFLVVFLSFGTGLLLAVLLQGIRGTELRRYGERLRKALVNLYTGYPVKSRSELLKLLDREETVPLYFNASKLLSEEPSVYLQKYSLGIVETEKALELFKKDRERAKDLLEKALGKNWDNLRARRLLRTIYYLEKETKKAIDLQRQIVEDSEKALKKREKSILADLLAELNGEGAVDEVEKLPPTPLALAVLIGSSDKKEKYVRRMFEEGLQNETLDLLIAKNLLSPEVIEEVERNREQVSSLILANLYASVGMYERLGALKEKLPVPIRVIIDKGYWEDRECYREVLSCVPVFECDECGKEYGSYTPVCGNCLTWHRLKIKGGS